MRLARKRRLLETSMVARQIHASPFPPPIEPWRERSSPSPLRKERGLGRKAALSFKHSRLTRLLSRWCRRSLRGLRLLLRRRKNDRHRIAQFHHIIHQHFNVVGARRFEFHLRKHRHV